VKVVDNLSRIFKGETLIELESIGRIWRADERHQTMKLQAERQRNLISREG
jgi:hypothetical protein